MGFGQLKVLLTMLCLRIVTALPVDDTFNAVNKDSKGQGVSFDDNHSNASENGEQKNHLLNRNSRAVPSRTYNLNPSREEDTSSEPYSLKDKDAVLTDLHKRYDANNMISTDKFDEADLYSFSQEEEDTSPKPYMFQDKDFFLTNLHKRHSKNMIPTIRFGRSGSVSSLRSEKVGNVFIPGMRSVRSDSIIPSVRFGRSDSMIPTVRFGRSDSMIPSVRFGRSDVMIPSVRFGRSDSMFPSVRFGRSDVMIPSVRFGRSDTMIPSVRFGRSDSMIPSVRLGRSDSMIPSLRFGKSLGSMASDISKQGDVVIPATRLGQSWSGSSNSLAPDHETMTKREKYVIPIMRPGRSSDSMIPTLRFGKSIDHGSIPQNKNQMIPMPRLGRSSNSMIPSLRFGRSKNRNEKHKKDDSMIPSPRVGRSNTHGFETKSNKPFDTEDNVMLETEKGPLYDFGLEVSLADMVEREQYAAKETDSEAKRNLDDNDTMIPYPRLGRESDSEEQHNSSNDSLIPQIRYGKSSEKEKTFPSRNSKPYFILPNIRPSRSFKYIDLSEKEKTTYPQVMLPYPRPGRSNVDEEIAYYDNIDEFLKTISGIFRRSGIHRSREEKTENQLLGDVMEISPNNHIDEEVVKELVKSDGDSSFYLIPYPRPGKRNAIKVKATKDIKAKGFKNSDYLLPYPRPGKRNRYDTLLTLAPVSDLESDSVIEFMESKRGIHIIPLPRPGRSNKILSQHRFGRQTSMLPYPRLGRSNLLLPYPRPGRSNLLIPVPRPGRSNLLIPFPRYSRSGTFLLDENER